MAITYSTRTCPTCGNPSTKPAKWKHVFCSPRCARLGVERQPVEERFWKQVAVGEPDACWPWIAKSVSRGGYGAFNVNRRMVAAHRFAFEITNGPIPSGMFVCHHCDNPPCCNPRHLFTGSLVDNHDDMIAKGRQPKNETHAKTKLSQSEVIAIRNAPGLQREIAAIFGVTQSCVSEIKSGKQRKHVTCSSDAP